MPQKKINTSKCICLCNNVEEEDTSPTLYDDSTDCIIAIETVDNDNDDDVTNNIKKASSPVIQNHSSGVD